MQLTSPQVGVGAHQAHDKRAGEPPRQSRALWKWPLDLQWHGAFPQALHPHTFTWCDMPDNKTQDRYYEQYCMWRSKTQAHMSSFNVMFVMSFVAHK